MGIMRSTRYFPGESEKGASPAGYVDLAAYVIQQAVKDMHGDGQPPAQDHVSATAFLASKDAALWLDVIGIDQADMLIALKWEGYAQALLDAHPRRGKVSRREHADGPQRLVLEQGIAALNERL
jgi:hypothetical protein